MLFPLRQACQSGLLASCFIMLFMFATGDLYPPSDGRGDHREQNGFKQDSDRGLSEFKQDNDRRLGEPGPGFVGFELVNIVFKNAPQISPANSNSEERETFLGEMEWSRRALALECCSQKNCFARKAVLRI